MNGAGSRKVPVILAVALLAAHAGWILSLWRPAYTGADASGYFVQARLIATQGTAQLTRGNETQYIGVHWLEGRDGAFHSRYPPGFPLLVAQVYRLASPSAALLVNPVLASLSVLCFLLLAWRWTEPWLALAGGLVVVLLAPFAEQALEGFAHMATTAAVLAALLFLERWKERPSATTGIIAGFLIGVIPTIRYPEAVMGVVLGVTALVAARSVKYRTSVWAIMAGAAIPLSALLWFNDATFGSPFTTGYGATQEQTAFGIGHLVSNLPRFGFRLLRDAAPVVLLGSVGILLMLRQRETRGRAVLLAALVGSVTLIYAAYYSPFADSRKMLPTLPLFVLAAITAVGQWPARPRTMSLALLLALHGAMAFGDTIPRSRHAGQAIARSAAVREGAAASIPDRSVVIAPLDIETVIEYEGRFRLVDWRLLWTLPAPPLRRGSPAQLAASMRASGDQAQTGVVNLPDTPEANARIRAAIQEAFAWAGDAAVYWIDRDGWADEVARRVAGGLRFEEVASISDPVVGTRPAPYAWWVPALPARVLRVYLE